jgi:aminoglycoside phosphotransferase (APT) family kinase protein
MTEKVPGIDVEALIRYLPGVLPGFDPDAALSVRLLAGGRSNLTCLLTQSGGKWVLRRPPLGHIVPSAHDMAREFRTLSFLDGTGYPAPRPLALCTDHSVLGVTFMVYEYAAGTIISDPAAARALTADQAGALSHSLIRTLIRLHQVRVPDPEPGRNLSTIGYLQRQVSRWIDQWQRNQTGDPLMDVALLLVYWEQPGDGLRQQVAVARELTTAPGFWTRDRILGEYLRVTGLSTAHLDVCLGLACLKLATILEGIHYRYEAGQALDELSAAMGSATPALIEMGLEVAAGHGLDALSG